MRILKNCWGQIETFNCQYGAHLFDLMQTGNEIDSDLVTIASGEEIPEDELVSIGGHFLEAQGHPMSQEAKNESIEKWRFAHLVWLLQWAVSILKCNAVL
ncbi:hypothetical protein AGMMS49543_28060 [Betaproteobacteria bacterium]|nr:hypothetical protein AGMMS49543_28060 [Betaproteobacteria bacterium]GHU24553.1 hypothetical protein AGMMS50243_27800 [Betaproteobacteria bacterium]